MEIILTRRGITEDEINDLRSALAAEDAKSNDMLIPDAEEVKVGNAYVRVKIGGLWFNWRRGSLSNIVINGVLYPLHGDEFLRINCIPNEDALNEEKQRLEAFADRVKEKTKIVYEELVAEVESEAQKRKDKMDKEFALKVG